MLIEQCWVSKMLSRAIEVPGYLLLFKITPSCNALEFICLLFIVFPYSSLLSECQSSIFAAEISFIFSQYTSSSHSPCPAHLSASKFLFWQQFSKCDLFTLWFIDPPRPFQGVCEVKTVFIVLRRHNLPFPVCWYLFERYKGKGVGIYARIFALIN